MSDKILAIGMSGTVGTLLKGLDEQNKLIGASRTNKKGYVRINERNKDSIEKAINETGANTVLLLSAISSELKCLANIEGSCKANTWVPQIVSEAAEATNAKLIYISTDYVYNGEIEGAKNESIRNVAPAGLYGNQKFTAESIVKETCVDSLILRISRVFSKGKERNCISNTAQQIAKNSYLVAATDQYFSPVLDEDLYKTIATARLNDLRGIFNCGGASRISRYNLMEKVKKLYQLDCIIEPDTLSNIKTPIFVPKDTSMNSDKLYAAQDGRFTGLDDAVDRIIAGN